MAGGSCLNKVSFIRAPPLAASGQSDCRRNSEKAICGSLFNVVSHKVSGFGFQLLCPSFLTPETSIRPDTPGPDLTLHESGRYDIIGISDSE
jgi:hypothetical protein